MFFNSGKKIKLLGKIFVIIVATATILFMLLPVFFF